MAFIFVPLLAWRSSSRSPWVYTSRCVVLVVETAARNEEVVWPDEGCSTDWMGGYMAWLVGVWLFPAFWSRNTQHLQADGKPGYAGTVLGTFC